DAVAETGQTESQYGHTEILGVIGWILAAQPKEVTGRNSEAGKVISEEVLDQAGGKIIVAGGDRSVGGEDQAGGGQSFCLLKRDVLRLHQAHHTLQAEKGGMALVHVINRGLQLHCFERAIAANA